MTMSPELCNHVMYMLTIRIDCMLPKGHSGAHAGNPNELAQNPINNNCMVDTIDASR